MKNQESTSNENKWLDNITLYKTARYDEIEEALEYLTSLFKDFDIKIFKTKEDSNGNMSIAVSGTDSELDALTDMYIENFNDIKDSCDLDAMGWTDPDDIKYYTEKGSAELRKSLYGESKKSENRDSDDYLQEIYDSLESAWDKSKFNLSKGYDPYYDCQCVRVSLKENPNFYSLTYVIEPGDANYVADRPASFQTVWRYPNDHGVGVGEELEFQSTDFDEFGKSVFDYFDELKEWSARKDSSESKKNENGNTPKDEVLRIMRILSKKDKVGQYIDMDEVKDILDDLTERFEFHFRFQDGWNSFVFNIHEDPDGKSDDDDEASKWNTCAELTDEIMEMLGIPQGKMLNAHIGENWEAIQWELYDGGIESNYIPEGSNESKQTKKNEDTIADIVIQVRKPGQKWSLYTVTWPEYVDMYKKEATEERGWPEVRVLKRGFNGRMDVIDGPEESKKSEVRSGWDIDSKYRYIDEFENLIGMDISDARKEMGEWWTLATQDVRDSRRVYDFKRSGLGAVTLTADKNNKVVKVSGRILRVPFEFSQKKQGESKKSEANDDNWVAYYFCKDPQGLEWAVLPHTANQIGNVNCLSERGGMDTIGMEYVLSKCTPVENLKDSNIYKAAINGEDRRIVPLKKADAERIFKSKNGLEELKAIVSGMTSESKKPESKKNEDTLYMGCHGFFTKDGKTYVIEDESPEWDGEIVGKWSKSDWERLDTDKVIREWRKDHPTKSFGESHKKSEGLPFGKRFTDAAGHKIELSDWRIKEDDLGYFCGYDKGGKPIFDQDISKAVVFPFDQENYPNDEVSKEMDRLWKMGYTNTRKLQKATRVESKKSEDTSVIHVNGENGNVDIYSINSVAINSDGSEDYLDDMATAKTYYDEDEAIKDAQELADSYKDDDRVVQVFVTAGEYEKPNGDIGGEPFDIFAASSSNRDTTAKYRKLAGYENGGAYIDYYAKGGKS